MYYSIQRTILLLPIFVIGLFCFQTISVAKENSQNLTEIPIMERSLFESDISVEQINQLLQELKDSKKRTAAKAKLSQNCHQHIQRMIDFARVCHNLEARQACADIVEALDASYRTTPNGKALQKLYRDQATQRLPEYWKRFQKNSNDHRAVAFLMAIDAKKTYAWLKTTKGHDRHDQIRYLLLRIRELEKDPFVLDHLFEHSLNGVRRAARDVFPHVIHRTGLDGFNLSYGIRVLVAHRFVGHVIIKPLAVRGSIPSGFGNKGHFDLKKWHKDQPFISSVTRYSKWIAVCRYLSVFKNERTEAFFLNRRPVTYSTNSAFFNRVNGKLVPRPPSVSFGIGRQFQSFRRELDYLPKGLYPVPRVHLKKQLQVLIIQGKISGWAKAYLAKQFHRYLYFTPFQSENSKPETIQAVDALKKQTEFDRAQIPPVITNSKKQLSKDALSVVILPPHFPTKVTAQEKVYAELISDYLASSLDNSHIARVVNRQNMTQILKEHAITKGVKRPLLSYDLIVRLDIQRKEDKLNSQVTVLDLSTGNPLATANVSFPLLKKDFLTIVKTCQQAIRKFKRPEKNGLKVRFLGVDNVNRNTRMNPLAHRLQTAIQESLRKSPQVTVVQHLEAMSSQEESLLLYSGLSRLAGGRLFAPQADATLGLRIQGKDVLGKDFKQTPVEIGMQFLKRTKKETSWQSLKGTVETFDKMITQSWKSIAKEIKGVPPSVVKDVLSNIATRHRQAEKELDAVERLLASSGSLQEAIQRASTALKLDPTSERARYTYLKVRRNEIFNRKKEKGNIHRVHHYVSEVRQYFQQFGYHSKHSQKLLSRVIEVSQFIRDIIIPQLSYRDNNSSKKMREILLDYLDILNVGSFKNVTKKQSALKVFYAHFQFDRATIPVYRGLRTAGMSLKEREAWMDELLQYATESAQYWKNKTSSYNHKMSVRNHIWLLITASNLAIEDGRYERSKKLLLKAASVLRQIPFKKGGRNFTNSTCYEPLLKSAARLDDASFRKMILQQFNTVEKKPAHHLYLNLFSNQIAIEPDRTLTATSKQISYSTPATSWRYHRIRPLIIQGDRLYLLMSAYKKTSKFAYVLLNKDGSPKGKIRLEPKARFAKKIWDGITFLPEPALHVKGEFTVTGVHKMNTKIYFGTSKNGMLVWDISKNAWTVFGPKQGLPEWSVGSFFPIDDHTFFCTSHPATHYTFDTKNGNIKLIHKANGRRQWDRYDDRFDSIWKKGDIWMGWSRRGLVKDILGKATLVQKDSQSNTTDRSNDDSSYLPLRVNVNGRKFIWNNDSGLNEYHSSGKTIRTWHGIQLQSFNGYARELQPSQENTFYPFFRPRYPMHSPLARVGDYLAITSGIFLSLYHPKKELWYGPFVTHSKSMLGTDKGLWLFGEYGGPLIYASLTKMINIAEKNNLVLTPEKFRQKKRDYLKTLSKKYPTLSKKYQAFGWIAEGEYAVAHKILLEVLKEDPDDSHTLLMTGFLHEKEIIKPARQAEDYYQKLIQQSDNKAVCTGMWRLIHSYYSQKKWHKARIAIDQFEKQFKIRNHTIKEFAIMKKQIASKLSKENRR